MLYAFKKYGVSSIVNRNIKLKITTKARQMIINSHKNVRFVYKFLHYSTFMRKSYFRSLLLYLNIIYSNFDATIDSNFFYPFKYTIIRYSGSHPSFYFRHRVIK